MRAFLVLLMVFFTVHAKEPFTDLEGVVGYIVVEKKGKVENYMVVEGKDGSVKMIKTERNPKQFLKRGEDESSKR